MKALIAEFIGTATLVFMGCGAAVIAGAEIGYLGISLAFGLSIVAMAYGIGPVSGCHINPAVSFGAWIAGRMEAGEMVGYWIAQCAGGVAGAMLLLIVASGQADYVLAENGLGQNGFGADYLGGYNLTSAFVFEAVATFLFLVTILGVTAHGAPSHLAGLAIGGALALIHIVGIDVTGVSVNPARSLGPAALVGGQALEQLWLFVAAPMLGAAAAGAMFRAKLLEPGEELV